MRKYFPTYEEAVSHTWLCNCSILNFLMYEENLIFFFISVMCVLARGVSEWVEDDFSPSDTSGLEAVNVLEVKII